MHTDGDPAAWLVPEASVIGLDVYNPWSPTNGKEWRSFGSKLDEVLRLVRRRPRRDRRVRLPRGPDRTPGSLRSGCATRPTTPASTTSSRCRTSTPAWTPTGRARGSSAGETEQTFAELLASDWVARVSLTTHRSGIDPQEHVVDPAVELVVLVAHARAADRGPAHSLSTEPVPPASRSTSPSTSMLTPSRVAPAHHLVPRRSRRSRPRRAPRAARHRWRSRRARRSSVARRRCRPAASTDRPRCRTCPSARCWTRWSSGRAPATPWRRTRTSGLPGSRPRSWSISTIARGHPAAASHLAGKATAPPRPVAPGDHLDAPPLAPTTRPTEGPARASGNAVDPSSSTVSSSKEIHRSADGQVRAVWAVGPGPAGFPSPSSGLQPPAARTSTTAATQPRLRNRVGPPTITIAGSSPSDSYPILGMAFRRPVSQVPRRP